MHSTPRFGQGCWQCYIWVVPLEKNHIMELLKGMEICYCIGWHMVCIRGKKIDDLPNDYFGKGVLLLEHPSIGENWNISGVPALSVWKCDRPYVHFLECISVIQKLTTMEWENGLVLSNTHVLVHPSCPSFWAILAGKFHFWHDHFGPYYTILAHFGWVYSFKNDRKLQYLS